MRKRQHIFAVAALFAMLLVLVAVDYPRTKRNDSAADTNHATPVVADDENRASERRPTNRSNEPRDREFDSIELGYRWNRLNPGMAANEADAQWLESKGFPGPDVEGHLLSLPVDRLKDLAERGNVPAQAIYALRLAQAGRPHADTQDVLLKSASSGSVYALKVAGDIFSSVEGYRDPVMASVFYGLQARRGDHAGFSQQYLVDGRLTTDQRLRAQVLSEATWRSIDILRRQGATPPFDLSVRPGFEEFVNQAVRPGGN